MADYPDGEAGWVMSWDPNPDGWDWQTGYMMWGMEKIWKATGEARFRDYILAHMNAHVNDAGEVDGFWAGMLHLPFWKFVAATAAGCLVTVPLQLGLGYFIAHGIGTMETADLVSAIIGVVILILAILLGLAWWRQHRALRQERPRAKAAWLRRFRPRSLRGKRSS